MTSQTSFMFRQQDQPDYKSQTYSFIKIVKDFCNTQTNWTSQRESEVKRMKKIKSKAEGLFGRFRRQKLEKKLGKVLKNIMEGLKELHPFLDAVEKLAVTSLAVFNTSDIRFMPDGMNPQSVQSYIVTARSVSLLLINFKRDDEAFFLPKLHNLDVLDFQLHKYICISKELCSEMKNPSLKLSFNMRESLTDDFSQLNEIRMDESFRMSFLFHEKAQHFIDTYRECQPRMDQFLLDLEKTAVELDKMKMGSSISTVAGSSLSAMGSVLTITSLVLAPATAGVSLVFTASGAVMLTISKVNSLITGVTEYAVNNHQGKKANNIFKNFMEDVQKVIDCLEQAASSKRPVPHVDEGNIILAATQMVSAGKSISKSTRDFIDAGMAMQALNSEEVATGQPDIRLLAKNTPLAMSKAVRYGSIAITAIYIGVDIAFIFKEGWSLAKGETSEASQLIRCISALWCSEMQAWKKIYEHLLKGKETYQRNLGILEF
ncbi:hypothetical protein SRHO_G00190600 [Serrasalmus rhombeus]